MRLTTNFTGKQHFLCIGKWLIVGLKAEQLRNKNNTEEWALGFHPRDNDPDSLDLRCLVLSFKSL